MKQISDNTLRAFVSVVAITGVAVHIWRPNSLDAIAVALLVFAFLPWLSPIIKSIEVTGFGKLELAVKKVSDKQSLLQKDLDGLRFVVSRFVTEFELVHLEKLDNGDQFYYERNPDSDARFMNELRRLRDLGLIEKANFDLPLNRIPQSGDLRKYVRITEQGRMYLKLRA